MKLYELRYTSQGVEVHAQDHAAPLFSVPAESQTAIEELVRQANAALEVEEVITDEHWNMSSEELWREHCRDNGLLEPVEIAKLAAKRQREMGKHL